MNDTATPRRLCKGARAIARRIGDESLAANLRLHPNEWPCFLVGDILVAYEDAIDAAVAEKERVGLQPMRPITRKRPLRGVLNSPDPQLAESAPRACEQRRQVLAERIAAKTQGEVAGGLK